MAANVTVKEFTDLKSKVCEHELWIDGNGKRGAKSRLDLLEDKFQTIEGKLNWILGLMGSMFVGLIIWAMTH